MVRCIECQKLPWQPEADLSFLPPARCDPALPAVRWRSDMLALERDCLYFVPKSVVQAGPDYAPDSSGNGALSVDQGPGNTSGRAETPARPEPSTERPGERPSKLTGTQKHVPKKGKGGR